MVFISLGLTTTEVESQLSLFINHVFVLQRTEKYHKQRYKAMAPVVNGIPPLVNKQEITTVFVGNITDKASDTLIRQILMKCGYIVSWKRVQGASGRLQAFGFCEYSEPEAGLRAMRLLSGYQVGDKKLLVKVDSKTRAQLDQFKEQKKIEKEVLTSATLSSDYDIEDDEETKNQDAVILKDIEKLLRDNMSELDSGILQTYRKTHSGNKDNLEGLDMNDDTKNLVAKEIRGFRETYKEDERKRDKEKEKEREKERESRERDDKRRDERREESRDRDRDHDREKRDREREKEREREREREKERDRERERERERRRKEREEREERERKGSDAELRRSTPSRRRSRSKSVDRDDDDAYETKRLERIKKVKETEYNERVKEWEVRERKKKREYEKQLSKEERKKNEEEEEKHRLLEFLEDYDDDRDDIKYYKGNALARRMRDRELEIQSDHRDKQREMEEIEEVLRKQMSGEISSDNKENTNSKDERSPEREKMSTKESSLPPSNPNLRPAFTSIQSNSSSPAEQSDASASPLSSPALRKQEATSSMKRELPQDENSSDVPASKKFGFGMKLNAAVANKKKLEAVFNANEDEVQTEQEPKKKLTRLDEESEAQKEQHSVEDKRKLIKSLIEKIPTVREELFAYPLKWEIVDQNLVEKRIKPWVNKKIFEYIGEEEQTLVDFICSKVLSKSNAKSIHEDVAMVLDEESEVFVVKMWRLLIYETEAKCLGLVKAIKKVLKSFRLNDKKIDLICKLLVSRFGVSGSAQHVQQPNQNATADRERIYQWILELASPETREHALLELSKKREVVPDLAPMLWHSFGTIAALLQEIVNIYPMVNPPNLTAHQSNRVCNALALLQCVASHQETRSPFLQAQIPLFLYPFLHTTSKTRPFEYLRLTSLGVVGALVKTDDQEVITFLLSTEIIPLCLRIMESGSELSKTVATFILQKILLDETGLSYICQTYERFSHVAMILGKMVLALSKEPSPRLLKHVVRCYLRLSDNPRAREALRQCLPEYLKDNTFENCLKDDTSTKRWLVLLMKNLQDTPTSMGDTRGMPIPP